MYVLKALVPVACSATLAGAQAPPIRQLGPAQATASEPVNAITNIRPLSDGRVIVGHRGRVMLFDANLSSFTVVFDSSKFTPGSRPVSGQIPMIPYLGDSTLLVDRNASSFVLLDPAGKTVRAIAWPAARDIDGISGFAGSRSAYVDPKGRLVYRGSFPRGVAGQPSLDSMPILRADFDTRTVDTLAVVRMPGATASASVRTDDIRRMEMITKHTPFPVIDQWTMLSDGTVAIARGSDYHVDWIDGSGKKSSTPKLPFDWKRITDEEKRRVLDSIIAQQTERARSDSIRAAASPPRPGSVVLIEKWTVAEPKDLPDYYPPLRETGMRADADGNVWLLPTTSAAAQGGLLYDVVNRRGEIAERVQLTPGCSLGAIARGGVVYLVCEGSRLERRRIVRPPQ